MLLQEAMKLNILILFLQAGSCVPDNIMKVTFATTQNGDELQWKHLDNYGKYEITVGNKILDDDVFCVEKKCKFNIRTTLNVCVYYRICVKAQSYPRKLKTSCIQHYINNKVCKVETNTLTIILSSVCFVLIIIILFFIVYLGKRRERSNNDAVQYQEDSYPVTPRSYIDHMYIEISYLPAEEVDR